MRTTGYRIKEIGADFMVEIGGWKQDIYSENLYSYTENAQDWSLWKHPSHVSAIVSDSALEVQIGYSTLDLKNSDKVDAMFYMHGYEGSEDFSDTVISNDEGVLIVNLQAVGTPTVTGDEQRLLMLQLRAQNEDIIVTDILLSRWGIGLDNDVSEVRLVADTSIPGTLDDGICEFHTDIQLSDGDSQTVYIEVDIEPDAIDNNSIGFKIDSPHDIITNKGTITLISEEPEPGKYDISYINSIPKEIVIDGAFADWQNINKTSDDPTDIDNSNLDISEYAVTNSSDVVSFYMKVDGRMCYGTVIPHENYVNAPEPIEPSTPGEPGPPSTIPSLPTPKTGEDIAYIYIDNDNQSTTGYSIGDLGAEHRIEITGRYGKIISSRHLSYRQSERIWIDEGDVRAEVESAYLETQIEDSELEISGPYKILFQTTDWLKSNKDISKEAVTRGTRGIVVIQPYNAANNTATATTNQRTLIRTIGQSTDYFFSFYYNNIAQNLTWEWSLMGDDDPWPNPPQFVFTNAYQNMSNISVWYDDTLQNIYVVADNESADNSVTVRSGSISGNTITWGSEVDVAVSTLGVGNKNAFISRDANGLLWVLSSTMEGIGNYGVAAARSQNPDDISLWDPSTTLTTSADDDATPLDVYPIILSIGTSGPSSADMYAVWYNSSGYIQGKVYDDSILTWGTLDNIDNTGSDATDGQIWGPSAVVDSTNRDVHIIYVNATGNLNYTKYNNIGRSPDLPKTIGYTEANFPTISLVGSDDLYAFWVNVSAGPNTNQIEGNFSTDLGNNWVPIIYAFTPNIDGKRFLTSVYYAPNEYLIGWHWTQDIVNDNDVLFERIPEFQDIIIPIFFTIFMIAVWRKKRKLHKS
jgi:hypothetical protein